MSNNIQQISTLSPSQPTVSLKKEFDGSGENAPELATSTPSPQTTVNRSNTPTALAFWLSVGFVALSSAYSINRINNKLDELSTSISDLGENMNTRLSGIERDMNEHFDTLHWELEDIQEALDRSVDKSDNLAAKAQQSKSIIPEGSYIDSETGLRMIPLTPSPFPFR